MGKTVRDGVATIALTVEIKENGDSGSILLRKVTVYVQERH